jgi:hypothetical protein
MKKSLYLFLVVAGVAMFTTAGAVAASRQGLLVGETGDVITGYSAVIIDNGLAYPVRDLEADTWYTVIIIGTGDDGTILCTVGEPLEIIPDGVETDESESNEKEIDDDSEPSPQGE